MSTGAVRRTGSRPAPQRTLALLVCLLIGIAVPADAQTAPPAGTAGPDGVDFRQSLLVVQHPAERFPVLSGPRIVLLEHDTPIRAPFHLVSHGETSAEERTRPRYDAMINGALIGLGALGIIDNVVFHWTLGWHRIIEDHPHALELEIGVVAVSTAMLVTGLVRERNARRREAGAGDGG